MAFPPPSEYLQGSIVVSDVHFKDPSTEEAMDPTTVKFYYVPNGEPQSTQITYTNATTPLVGTIARLGVGWYRTWIDSTLFVGLTTEFWDGLGANQAPGQRQFIIIPRGQGS